MKPAFSFGLLVLLLTLVFAGAAQAVKPDEMLANPVLEARARALSKGLRCLVCQNQSIDESEADLAHDLRILLRQRLVEGDSDQQAIDFIVSRYGEFVLLKPRFNPRNAALWATPVVLLLAGGLFMLLRARSPLGAADPLSAEEQAALGAILRHGEPRD